MFGGAAAPSAETQEPSFAEIEAAAQAVAVAEVEEMTGATAASISTKVQRIADMDLFTAEHYQVWIIYSN